MPSFGRGWRLGGVAIQPGLYVVVVELLAPEHPGGCLAENRSFLRGDVGRCDGGEIFVRFGFALGQYRVETVTQVKSLVRKAQAELGRRTRSELHAVVKSSFGPAESGVDRRGAVQEVIRNPVLRVRRAGRTPKLLGVGVVFTEQWLRQLPVWPRPGYQYSRADRFAIYGQELSGAGAHDDGWLDAAEVPAPPVAVPDRREDVEDGGIRPGIAHFYLP